MITCKVILLGYLLWRGRLKNGDRRRKRGQALGRSMSRSWYSCSVVGWIREGKEAACC